LLEGGGRPKVCYLSRTATVVTRYDEKLAPARTSWRKKDWVHVSCSRIVRLCGTCRWSGGNSFLGGIIIYVFLIVLLRLTGKRQVGQLSPFDLVLLLV